MERLVNKVIALEAERETLQQRLAKIDTEIADLKMEIADRVIRETVTFVRVQFCEYGKFYDYIWEHEELPNPGDTVRVETARSTQEALVAAVVKGKRNPELKYKYAHPLQ